MANPPKMLVREAACIDWDVIVIGAGPAGSLAARQLALGGLKTLLVDAKVFPREKVCGGYLNRRALGVLEQTGLSHLTGADVESQVRRVVLLCRGQRASFPLPAGRVVSRTTFDAALVDAAQMAGSMLISDAQAIVTPTIRDSRRLVAVNQHGNQETLAARVVVCADGLARSSIRRLPEFTVEKSPASRVGFGAVVSAVEGPNPAGQITMVVSRHGYVGISRFGPDQLNIAAAIDQELLSRDAPQRIVGDILEEVGITMHPALESANWRGTPALTSRPNRVSSERLFLIGDAAGYVEPFTGEGMAAALETAVAVAPLVRQAATNWLPSMAFGWTSLHRQIVCERQSTCRQLAWVLRRPWAARTAIAMCRSWPQLAGHLISKTVVPCPALKSPGISIT